MDRGLYESIVDRMKYGHTKIIWPLLAVFLFMAGAALADDPLSHLSNKLFGDPMGTFTPGQRAFEIEEQKRRQWIDRERARQEWEVDKRIYERGERILDEDRRFLESLGKRRRDR